MRCACWRRACAASPPALPRRLRPRPRTRPRALPRSSSSSSYSSSGSSSPSASSSSSSYSSSGSSSPSASSSPRPRTRPRALPRPRRLLLPRPRTRPRTRPRAPRHPRLPRRTRLRALPARVLGLALFLLHDLVVAADDLAVVDLAAPALELVLLEDRAGHDVAPEVPQLRACPAALRPPDVSGLLEEALRVVLQDHQDPRQVGRQLVEGDRTVHVALLALGPPDDAVIGHLVDDRGLPGAV